MANRFWVGGTASWDGTAGLKWSTTSGGAGGAAIPTSADDVYLDAASGAVTVTVGVGNTGCRSLVCTGFTGTLAGTTALSVYGSLTKAAGMGWTYSGTLTFAATTAGHTITSAGLSYPGHVAFNGVGGSWTLQDAFSTAGQISWTVGDVADGGYSGTCSVWYSNNNNVRSRNLTGTWTITGTNASVWWEQGSNLTGIASPSLIETTNAAATAKTILSVATAPLNDVRHSGGGQLTASPILGRDVTIASAAGGFTNGASTTAIRHLDLSAATAGTWAGLAAFSLSGDLTLNATLTRTHTSPIAFNASAGTQRTTMAGVALASNLTLNNVGAVLQLQDDLTTSGSWTHTSGALDVNGFTLAWSSSRSVTCTEPTAGGGASVIGSSVIRSLGRCAS